MTHKEYVEVIAERSRTTEFNGRVEVNTCSLCGYSRVVKTSKDGEGVCDIPVHPNTCTQCDEIRNRAPEIYNWVVNMLHYQLEIGAK